MSKRYIKAGSWLIPIEDMSNEQCSTFWRKFTYCLWLAVVGVLFYAIIYLTGGG